MTTNYLQMMIDSLNKKKGILIRIIELNEEQNQILSEETLNGDAFDDNMKAKGSASMSLICWMRDFSLCLTGSEMQLMLIKKCMLMRYRS